MVKIENIEMEVFNIQKIQKDTNITLFTKKVIKTIQDQIIFEQDKKIEKMETIIKGI